MHATLRSAALVSLALAAAAFGGDDEPPADWREAAAAAGLSPEHVKRLAADAVLVGPQESKQVFDPYIGSDLPVFVTSDSILHAYHVMFEEGLARVERVRATRLAGFARAFWDGIPAACAKFDLAKAALADARRRAQVTVGVALRLLGEETPGADAESAKLLDEETRLVEAAEGRTKPAWLGAPDDGFPFVDYGRFRPSGLYAADERLARYFRATAWLQAIPFRASRTDELTAALLLRESPGAELKATDWDRAFDRSWKTERFVDEFAEFVGKSDDRAVTSSDGLSCPKWDAPSIAAAAADIASRARGRDGEAPREATLRLLPPAAPADVRLLELTTGEALHRDVPSGLDVAAALGSAFARERLAASGAKQVLPLLDRWNNDLDGGGLYALYLYCIAALVDEPEKDAPAFVRGEAWAAKSTNELLAGWAQWRHAWALQVRESVHYLGVTETEPGFVEPDPEFFSRLAFVVERTTATLSGAGAFSEQPGRLAFADDVRRFAAIVASAGDDLESVAEAQGEFLGEMVHLADVAAGRPPTGRLHDDAARLAALRRAADELSKLVPAIEAGGALPAAIADAARAQGLASFAQWSALASVCRRLEAMAHKQLRGAPWSPTEREFLRGYGEDLAHLLGYEGDSWHHARDDVPRATSVYAVHRPGAPSSYLHAATGRPRELFVLYPVGERLVLCRGAVMTYFEFVRAARLPDAEWRALLGGKERPAAPEWMARVATAEVVAPGEEK